MEYAKLEWDDLTCEVLQDYIDRGFNLVEGAAPWLSVTEEDICLTVTESWECEQVGWMFTDIQLSFEELVWKMLNVSNQIDTPEEQQEEKQRLIRNLNKLIKKIESF